MHVLVIGGGSIGERHARCFLQTGQVDVSLCDVRPEIRDRLANTYALKQTFADFSDALATKPDVAVICTPAHLHVGMAIDLVNAGCHVLMEKPVSTSFDRVDELSQLVEQKKTVFGVAYVLRCHPIIIALREVIQSGRFGKPVELTVVTGQHFPTFRPAYREIYYTNRATGGGCLQDALTHIVNSSEWIVGPITELTADAAHQILEGVTVEDTAHVLARHGNVMSSFAINQHQAPNELTLTIVCERGTVRMESHLNRLRWTAEPNEPWHDEEFPPMERDDMFVTQAQAFLDAVQGKRQPACTLAEGVQTLKVILGALEVLESRTWKAIL
ncbi:MAG: Gfo/Idh/MocA family oxidoreductase [Planctomycetota bacterium]|nr:Gfo/Idh/MocA family oxidoreductase [Planctomycetota bacterium]MDA1211319.1 Gfo/Idh/MocA family oxidoreductase [Planctomycetota bacterium]